MSQIFMVLYLVLYVISLDFGIFIYSIKIYAKRAVILLLRLLFFVYVAVAISTTDIIDIVFITSQRKRLSPLINCFSPFEN